MVSVVCKFRMNGISYQDWGSKNEDGSPKLITSLEFVPVGPTSKKKILEDGRETWEYVPDPENRKFWDASPSGDLKLGTVNRDAVKMLDIGKEYYVIITDYLPDATRQVLGLGSSSIFVNGRSMPWSRATISYTELVSLVKPGSAELFTVSFAHGPATRQTGTLTPGESVDVVEGMVFEADVTGNA